MSTLSNLLKQVEQRDPQLAEALSREVKALGERREFGLNFERHTPEAVELPGRPVRKGDKVHFLAERGQSASTVNKRLWRVQSIASVDGQRIATLIRTDAPADAPETATRAVDDLVVVAEFRDPIYPGLVSTGKVERGGDKPYHSVINAENFHALQALLYTHEGKVDAIYIDPPYNTGAKDWKYNNDYVDGEDIYRHSKWLAFIERRLKLAKRLLNPEGSVLIFTIDEKEYLRAGLLLQQVFPEAKIQMVSSVINPAGVARGAEFARVEEYIFILRLGSMTVSPWSADMLTSLPGGEVETEADGDTVSVQWDSLLRRGTGAARRDRPNMFYPVWVDPTAKRIHSVGDPLALDADRNQVVPPEEGLVPCWPLRTNGTEGRWKVGAPTLTQQLADGTARLGAYNVKRDQWAIGYLYRAERERIARGETEVVGREESGALILRRARTAQRTLPKSVWNVPSHNAAQFGTGLLRMFLPDRSFPFPKSLYAVEDSLRFFVAQKPDALIADFFSGSGTTAHAVMRMNKQDGGCRRSISVTNNEVSVDEQAGLRAQDLRPGDAKWEALGICDYITKPRIRAAITGKTPSGEPVAGDYRFVDEFPMSDGFEENVEFFTLTYETPRAVAHNRSFEAIAPLLWMRAGARGRRIDKATDDFDVADMYGVLFDMDYSHEFLAALHEHPDARMAFLVTDDDRAFQMVCAELPQHVEPIRLYESYLTNFTINTGRE